MEVRLVNKEVKIDSQLTAMAGGFLTAGKLLKRGYHVSLTIRNGKAVDLFVHNPKTNRAFSVAGQDKIPTSGQTFSPLSDKIVPTLGQ
jgi:hypothetical protein